LIAPSSLSTHAVEIQIYDWHEPLYANNRANGALLVRCCVIKAITPGNVV